MKLEGGLESAFVQYILMWKKIIFSAEKYFGKEEKVVKVIGETKVHLVCYEVTLASLPSKRGGWKGGFISYQFFGKNNHHTHTTNLTCDYTTKQHFNFLIKG